MPRRILIWQKAYTMNRKVRRGEIFWFDFEYSSGSIQNGRRPAIVIQADNFNENSPTTVVAPITSVHKCRHLPSHVFIGEEFGLAQPSMILLEQFRIINQDSLGPYIGIVNVMYSMRSAAVSKRHSAFGITGPQRVMCAAFAIIVCRSTWALTTISSAGLTLSKKSKIPVIAAGELVTIIR